MNHTNDKTNIVTESKFTIREVHDYFILDSGPIKYAVAYVEIYRDGELIAVVRSWNEASHYITIWNI